jgi:hypothetical protein
VHCGKNRDIADSTRNLNVINTLLRNQFELGSHDLETSDLMRSEQRQVVKAGLDQKTPPWLMFAGGQRSKSAGLVEAFTGANSYTSCFLISYLMLLTLISLGEFLSLVISSHGLCPICSMLLIVIIIVWIYHTELFNSLPPGLDAVIFIK